MTEIGIRGDEANRHRDGVNSLSRARSRKEQCRIRPLSNLVNYGAASLHCREVNCFSSKAKE